MYGAQKRDTVVINRIHELPEPVQFFVREVFKKQHVPIVAIFYQDEEPYAMDNWDWDGGLYEVFLVYDNVDDKAYIAEIGKIVKAQKKTELKYGSIYVDDVVIGYWSNRMSTFLHQVSIGFTYASFIFKYGKLVYAAEKFITALVDKGHINYLLPEIAGTYKRRKLIDFSKIEPEIWLSYAFKWFDIANCAYERGHFAQCAYLYRLSIETGIKALYSKHNAETNAVHNLSKFIEDLLPYEPELSNLKGSVDALYREHSDFRYPDSSWIPTKEDIEKIFRPTAKKILDYVSRKISQ